MQVGARASWHALPNTLAGAQEAVHNTRHVSLQRTVIDLNGSVSLQLCGRTHEHIGEGAQRVPVLAAAHRPRAMQMHTHARASK